MTRLRYVPTRLLPLAALLLAGCFSSGTLPDVPPVTDDDDTVPDDDDTVPDDDDTVPDDDDTVPDDDDIVDDDDITPPVECISGPDDLAPPDLLMSAMEVPLDLVFSGPHTPDSDENMFATRSGLGGLCPLVGQSMALLSTGIVSNIESGQDHDYPGEGPDGAAGDTASLLFAINVPEDAHSLSFYFQWMTREYPEWVDGPYGDGFKAVLWVMDDPPPEPLQIALDLDGSPIDTTEAEMRVFAPELLGSGFDEDGATGWLKVRAPVPAGGQIEMQFVTFDVADGIFDSAVLLDGFEFSPDELPEPTVELVWP